MCAYSSNQELDLGVGNGDAHSDEELLESLEVDHDRVEGQLAKERLAVVVPTTHDAQTLLVGGLFELDLLVQQAQVGHFGGRLEGSLEREQELLESLLEITYSWRVSQSLPPRRERRS